MAAPLRDLDGDVCSTLWETVFVQVFANARNNGALGGLQSVANSRSVI